MAAAKKDDMPLNSVRRVLERIGEVYGLDIKVQVPEKIAPWTHPTRSGEIICDGKFIGIIFEVNPFTAKKFGLESRVAAMELNLEALLEVIGKATGMVYRKVAEYPSAVRDLAFVVDNNVAHDAVVETLKAVDPIIEAVELFDVYSGEAIGEGKKSMAYRLTLSRSDRTLTSAEVSTAMTAAGAAIKKKFGAEIRK
jgi:phenylalanyl-tRNA synthetase beta chain